MLHHDDAGPAAPLTRRDYDLPVGEPATITLTDHVRLTDAGHVARTVLGRVDGHALRMRRAIMARDIELESHRAARLCGVVGGVWITFVVTEPGSTVLR